MKKLVCMLGQTLLLCAIYFISHWFVDAVSLPVPANIVGILVLFFLLCAGIVKEKHIKEAAEFLLQHLMFFFVPITVGLMNFMEVFEKYGWVLVLAICISSLVSLFVVGVMAQWQQKKKNLGVK